MSKLPRLTPLPVEWRVSTSIPYLTLSAAEAAKRSPTAVELYAYYREGTLSRVRMVFESGLWVKWCPGYADSEVVREADYDWSEVPRITVEDYEQSRLRYHESWAASGLCPNPGAYEVHGSSWLREIKSAGAWPVDYRHYLILGHDVFVEVLATGWHAEELTARQPV